jgi:AhpD family alkylhydroperoxidase
MILKRLDSAERELGGSMDYLRHILSVSLRAFFKFAKILPLSEYRRALPVAPYYVARIVAARHEDCGTCVQIEVNLARKAGLSPEVLRAVLNESPAELPEELAEVYRFAEAVVNTTGEEGPYREGIRKRFGEEALVDLAFGIAASRVFPITKRALGFAVSCQKVDVKI